MFNDAVLNKIESCAYEIVSTTMPSFGRYPNASISEYLDRWNYEKECLEVINHLLGLVDKNEIQDVDLYNLQTLCVEVLASSVQKGFIEGAEQLLQRIGLGLIEKQEIQIEEKQRLVEELLGQLVKICAEGYGKYLTSCNNEQNMLYMGSLRSRTNSLLKHIYNGQYGKWLKRDVAFCNKLLADFNEYCILLNGNWVQIQSLGVKAQLQDIETIIEPIEKSVINLEMYENDIL